MTVSHHVADEPLPPKLVTRNGYAKMRGLSFAAVEKAVFEGRMTLLPGGLVDPEAADREWAASTGPKRGIRQPNGVQEGGSEGVNGTHTLTQLRARSEQLKIEMAEVELAKIQGEMVPVADVDKAQFERARRVRDAVLQVSQQCAAATAASGDPRECYLIIDRAIREALGVGPTPEAVVPERRKAKRGRATPRMTVPTVPTVPTVLDADDLPPGASGGRK